MRYLIIIFLFLSLKGYGQTDATPNVKFKVATIGLLDSLFGEPEISVFNGSFGTKVYIDTLRFLGHLSDEYLLKHGYDRINKVALNLPDTINPKPGEKWWMNSVNGEMVHNEWFECEIMEIRNGWVKYKEKGMPGFGPKIESCPINYFKKWHMKYDNPFISDLDKPKKKKK